MSNTAIFFWLILGLSSSAWAKVAIGGDANHVEIHQTWEREEVEGPIDCPPLYQWVGGHCLFVDRSLFGPWQEVRDVCIELGGDLPNLSDANFLSAINVYLIANRLDDVSYWVGSNDQKTEGAWTWVSDNSEVKMGTPLWGDLADKVQQPTGGDIENCGALLQGDHLFMHDADCNELYSLLCVTSFEDTTKNVTSTRINKRKPVDTYVKEECPSPYEMLYGKCIFINTLAKNTWHVHKNTCENLGGHMAKLNDANLLGAIYDRLEEEGIKSWIWIGASDEEQEGDWRWHDNTQVPIGTPFWGDFGDGPQNPDGGLTENCAALFYGDHYFFRDYECNLTLYVICQKDI